MWTRTAGLKGKPLNYAITTTAVMGFLLFGYDQGLMSGLIGQAQFNNEFPPTRIPENATEAESQHVSVIRGAVTACYEVGCALGAILTLFFGDRLGRTRVCLAGGTVMTIGAVISTASFGPQWGMGQFVVGRVVSGFGTGSITASVPVWQGEIASSKNRGFLVCLEGAVIAVGTFIAYWVDFGLEYVEGSVAWRFPVALQVIFSIFMTIGIFFLPESPRWLVAHGYEQEAATVIAALQSSHAEDEMVLRDLALMKADVQNSGKSGNLMNLFKFGKTQEFQRAMLGSSTQFFQQFTGCNAAIYYSTLLFEETINLDRRLSLILGGVFATIYAISTIPSFFLVERLGRRKLFLIGFAGQGLAFIITFACLINPTEQNARGAAVGIYIFIIFFAFTILPLPWIYPPEINPLRTRTAAAAVSTTTNWVTNAAVVLFTPVFADASPWGVYLFFAIINVLGVPFAYFFYPETAGRHLEEIDLIFAKSHVEKKWAFVVANEMPRMDYDQINETATALGLREATTDIGEKEKGLESPDGHYSE